MPPNPDKKRDTDIFIIEASLEGKTLNIKSYEKAHKEEKTLIPYQEKELSIEEINYRCQEILNLLIQANRSSKPDKGVIDRLKEEGEQLYNNLFTPEAKKTLLSTQLDNLIVSINDRLVQVPWELLFDGEEFFCRKYNLGRVVRTRQEPVNPRQRETKKPVSLLILYNPTGDPNLTGTYMELQHIRTALMGLGDMVKLEEKGGNVDIKYVKKTLRRYDLIHYCGHACYDLENPSNSAWILKDGRLAASSILEMGGGKQTLPALIFANACQSGQTGEWEIVKGYSRIYGLAHAFLLTGVRHYIGTCWEIQDEASSQFAVEFYKELAGGTTVGEAVRRARLALIEKYPEENLTWASYMLYGDPTYCYIASTKEGRKPEKDQEEAGLEPAVVTREKLRTEPIEAPSAPFIPGKKKEATAWSKSFLYIVAGLFAALLMSLILMNLPLIKSYFQSKEQIIKLETKSKVLEVEKKEAELEKREWDEIHGLAEELGRLKTKEESKGK